MFELSQKLIINVNDEVGIRKSIFSHKKDKQNFRVDFSSESKTNMNIQRRSGSRICVN